MSDETPGATQGALSPLREGHQHHHTTPQHHHGPRQAVVVAECPATTIGQSPTTPTAAVRFTQVAGGYVLTTTSQPHHGVPALAQITPGTLTTSGGVTRIISLSPSRVNQTSTLRPSQANQSIVDVLTKSRPSPNVRLQLFQGNNNSGGESSTNNNAILTATSMPVQTSPVKMPVKRLLPSSGQDKKDTYPAKLQRVMNHRIVKSKLIKEKYNEHLMEAYFLEAGGNILDLYQFAKKPKSQAYLAYLREHAIDPKEVAPPEEPPPVTQSVPSTTPQATLASSLPGISHSHSPVTTTSVAATTPSSSSHVVANNEPKPSSSSSSNGNGSAVKVKAPSPYQTNTNSTSTNQEQIVEKAKQEAYVVQRISDLQKEGLWSEKRLPKVQEMHRTKAHWDFLLEEMVWLAADFAQERKWKKAAAKKCARMVQKYFQDKALAAQRAEKAQEQHMRRVAAFCAKEIRNFWNNVEKLVEYKQHTILEEKRKKALDQQLSFIVDQTEKYSQLLAEGMNRTTASATDNTAPVSTVSSRSVSRVNSDEEFQPDSQNSSDDEETIAQEEAAGGGNNAEQNEEVAALQRESEMDLDDFLKGLPKDYLENRDKITLDESGSSEGEADEDKPPDENKSKSDEEFTANITSDEDDEDTIQEQEKVEGKQDHKQELEDLKAENEMSVEELRNKYSGPPPSPPESSEDAKMSEDASDDETMGSDDDLEAKTEEEETADSLDESDSDQEDETMDVSEKTDVEDLGLKLLLEDSSRNEADGGASKTDENDALINDAAAIAESIQPKGNTLSSTTVSTKVPFLLKLPLREYQHIGLDWLVTMFERKLNGILADEMGLGKTIQTIALLSHLACEKENWGPHLIVVPTSVMLNWEMECKKWCPAFKILTYYGTQKERKLKRMGWTKPNAFHICITSYKLVIQDHQSFRRKKWKYLILDEAQNIKNFKSQRWQLLLNFQTQQRLLLTGTPLQNNLMELWSLMHFLMPNVFQSHREFKEWFSNPVTGMIEGNNEYNESIIKRLHKVLRPFLLRRLKSEVEKQMPKKYEHVVMCRLSKRQRFLYDDYMSRAKTRETLASGNLLSVINVLMQLRKVCNHPNLFEVRPTISPFLCDGITLHIPSLVHAVLEYDVWKQIDLSWLNLNLIDMEFYLGAYQSYRMRRIRTPRKVIEMNAVPDKIPQPPPCRLTMRIKKGEENKQPAASKPEKKNSNPNGKNAQNVKVKVAAPQYGVQLLQQQGVVKAIPVNIAQGGSMLKTSDKISASFAQLVQTSTGKHLLLTSNPGISGNIPVTTTTSGGQKLTFLSKKPLLTSATNAPHQITKAFMKIQLTAVTANTTNTTSTVTTSPAKSVDKNDLKSHGAKTVDNKIIGTQYIDQLYANQSNNLDVRWDSNCNESNDLGSSDEGDNFKDELKTRLEIMARVNERRCFAVPLYGEDFRKVVEFCQNDYNLTNSWTAENCHSPITFKELTDHFQDLVYTPERRIDQIKDICDRFIFYVPPVRAPEPEIRVWHPKPSTYWGQVENKKLLSAMLSKPTTSLHPIASAMVTQFPDPRLIQYDCGKLQTLDKLLRRLKSGGHRVLIFTQMTKMLDVLEAFLNFHGHIYLRLDGTTKVDQRQLLMERFNGDNRIFAFILSTRSGGIGVNLTGADTVIFYDSDWNPTMDAQAQDRCHRIGQTRDVHIYRLVSERTIEENILKKANQKRLLGDLAIEGGNFTTAYFKSSTIQDLFNVDQNEDSSAASRMAEVVESSRERRQSQQQQQQQQQTTATSDPSVASTSQQTIPQPTLLPGNGTGAVGIGGGGDEKNAIGALESALAQCEDDQDVQAARTAKAEAVADLAEFDENIPLLDDADKEREPPEMSKAEQEIDNVIKKLSPIERYAMRFIEETESAWSAEQLAAAEREIEEQKREWERNRLAAMREEEERRARELEEESDMLTFSREDATNQIWVSDNTMEQMPMWCPPTPPQQDSDIYIDQTMSFLYDINAMPESQLPPVYVKKEPATNKRTRQDAGFVDNNTSNRRPMKMARKEDPVSAPRSLFHSSAVTKVKRDLKLQKYRGGVIRPAPASAAAAAAVAGAAAGTVAGRANVPKPVIETPLWHEWTIHEDMALLKVIQSFQGLPLNLCVASPGLTPNWDFVSDYVNTVSIIYRSPKQCRHRYEVVLIQREEGKQVVESPARKKKKANNNPNVAGPSSSGGVQQQKFAFQPTKTNNTASRPMRTSQLYTQDNNATFSQHMIKRYDGLKAIIASKRVPLQQQQQQRASSSASSGGTNSNPLLKNPKHTAMLTECGIDLDRPVLPVELAARRAERLATMEKKKLTPEQQQQMAVRLQTMKSVFPGISQQVQPQQQQVQQQQQQVAGASGTTANNSGSTSGGGVIATSMAAVGSTSGGTAVTGSIILTQQQTAQNVNIVASQATTNVGGGVPTIVSVAPATPPGGIRSQRILTASPLHHHAQTVVSVSGLTTAQFQAAAAASAAQQQRIIVSSGGSPVLQGKNDGGSGNVVGSGGVAAAGTTVATNIHAKPITAAQLQLLRQQNFKQHLRVQAAAAAAAAAGQGVKTSTVTIGGQQAVVQFTQATQQQQQQQQQAAARQAAQFVRQGTVTIGGNKNVGGGGGGGMTRTTVVTESEVGQLLLKKQQQQLHQQQQQQQKTLTVLQQQQQVQQGSQQQIGGVTTSTANIQGLSTQVLAQAIQQAGGSSSVGGGGATTTHHHQVATLVKTVSNAGGGVTQTVTIPVSGVALAGSKTLTPATLKATNAQHLKQLHIQQQLLAQRKLNSGGGGVHQKLNIAQSGGGGGMSSAGGTAGGGGSGGNVAKGNMQTTTQLIVGSAKPLSTAMTVQQFQQVMRAPLLSRGGPVVLAKGTAGQRVIPVNAAQGTKQTIQVVAASQALSSALRPQAGGGTSSTLAGALAGIKVQGQPNTTTQQQQAALLSQVSAALQNQTVAVRQGSPVRLQTASGASIVAVTVQPTNAASMQQHHHHQQQQQQQQQQGTSSQFPNLSGEQPQVSRYVKKS